MIHKQFPQSIICHYMDDILLANSDINILERMFDEVEKNKSCLSEDLKSPLKKYKEWIRLIM